MTDLKEIERFASDEAMKFMRESGNELQSVCDRGHDTAVDMLLERGLKVEDYKIGNTVTRNFNRGPDVRITVVPRTQSKEN